MNTKYISIVLCLCMVLGGWLLARADSPSTEPASQAATQGAATQFSPKKLGRSWRDQADEAIGKKDYAAARDLYLKWLEADPRDSAAWYNLACVYSRLQETDKAFEALDTSVVTGNTNARQAERDSDLNPLQGDPRFAAAIDHMAQREKMNAPAGFIRRFTPMVSMGTYIVMLPPDYQTSEKKYPLCVILHGLGSSEERHGRLADQAGREGVIYIAVRAPYPWFGQLPAGQHGWNAWPPDAMSRSDPAMQEVPKEYVEWVFQCVHDAQKNYRVEPGKVAIFGHSQGAEYALNCALVHPEEVNSIFVQAGFLPKADQLPQGRLDTPENLAAMKKNDVHVHLLHGRDDTTVSPENSKQIMEQFQGAGIDVTLQMIPGNHPMTQESVKAVRAWLDADVRGK